MDHGLTKKNDGFRSVADIPKQYVRHKGLTDFINRTVGSDRLKNQIFAIVDTDRNQSKVYLMYTNKGETAEAVTRCIRTVAHEYNSNRKAWNFPLHAGIIKEDMLLQTLITELDKKNKLPAKSRVIDEKAEQKVSNAEKLLAMCMRFKASDFHIESDGVRAHYRMRVNKELADIDSASHDEAVNLANIFFAKFIQGDEHSDKGSGKGIYQSNNILDGDFSRTMFDDKFGEIKMKARLVNIGQNHGERFTLVMRLIDKSKASKPVPYRKMNFSEYACEKLKVLQTASRGMVLIGGVTGSGKSTTMQNMIMQEQERFANSRKIYSLEQPIEQVMDRVVQINASDSYGSGKNEQVHSSQDFGFENINRALMRGDPDTIAYGEIRDKVTAEAAIKGAESGHLVYGTMHIQRAIGAFSRFESFGVPVEKLCNKGLIKMIMLQHLIPKLCPHCSTPYSVGDEIPEQFGEMFAIKTFKNAEGKSLPLEKVLEFRKTMTPRDSLIRRLQKEQMINSKDALGLFRKIEILNQENDNGGLKRRIEKLVMASSIRNEDANIRFRGDGCDKCLNGTTGVVPAVEIILPDETFLELIATGKTNKADNHWKAKLDGRSACRDTYDKILSGMVDPRSVEEELDERIEV